MPNTGDIIASALSGMREHGWVRNYRHALDGKMCALGALECAKGWQFDCSISVNYDPALLVAAEALSAHIPTDWSMPACMEPWASDTLTRVAQYNNSRANFGEIEEWFEKTAADEGVTL